MEGSRVMKNGLKKVWGVRNDRCSSTMLSVAVLTLCALMLSIGTFREVRIATEPATGPIGGVQASIRPARQADLEWYIRSGQWRADIRSLAAAIQYLAEQPVKVTQTNGRAIRADHV